MLTVEFKETKGRPFGAPSKSPTGSRRFAQLSDGSVVKWRRGRWYRQWFRWNSAVATSLTCRAMTVAHDKGKVEEVREVYDDCEAMLKRLVGLVGSYEAIRIVTWIARREC